MSFSKFFIFLLSMFTPLWVAAACTQEAGFNLTPSLSPIANNTGGVLSNTWHTADFQVGCGEMWAMQIRNTITATGLNAGQTVLFGGVAYSLFTTSESNVYYFGAVAGPDGVDRPLGTSYAHAFYPPNQVPFKIPATVKIRFYSPSRSMTPGVHTINAAQLVKGSITVGSSYTESLV